MPKYTKECLEDALKACFDNGMSINAASKEYGIPKGTLFSKVHGKHPGKRGAPTALPDIIESRLVMMIKFYVKWRLPLSGVEFCNRVKEILDNAEFKCLKFKNNLPKKNWLSCFLKRNKIVLPLSGKSRFDLFGEVTLNVSLLYFYLIK